MFSTLELRVGDAYPALMILSSDSYSGSLPDSLDASLFNLPRRSIIFVAIQIIKN